MLRFVPRARVSSEPIEGFDPLISALLRARGVDTAEKAEQFLSPSMAQLHDPMLMDGLCLGDVHVPGMAEAVRILQEARDGGRRVMVYGDYDCDGVGAAAILMETLAEFGVEVSFRLPLRAEGYGLNKKAVDEIADAGWDILLTVDCGITNIDEVLHARARGLTVIVSDHHQLADTLPPADAVLHPLCENYPFHFLCGAGVALKLTQALLGMEAVARRIDIAALSTVADLVPLTGENRAIVAEGLKRMHSTERIGLQELMRVAQVNENSRITADRLGYSLAPRINAGGRLGDAAPGVRLLITRDRAEARELAERLEACNSERKNRQQTVYRAAEEQMLRETDFREDRILIVTGREEDGWEGGIVGLAAGRLCEKYHYPVIALSEKADGTAVGSCRSIPGVNIHRMLTGCKDLFVRFGGHAQAAGLTIRTDLVPEMRRRLNLLIAEQCDPLAYIPTAEYDQEIPLREVTEELIGRLALLEPTGTGNPSPLFLLRDATVQRMAATRDGEHLQLDVTDGEEIMHCIAFHQGHRAQKPVPAMNLLYKPIADTWQKVTTVKLQVEQLRDAGGALPGENEIFIGLLQELAGIASNFYQIPPAHAEAPQDQGEGGTAGEKRPMTAAALKKLLAASCQGVLLIGHERTRAAEVTAGLEIDRCLGEAEDIRCFNTLLLNPRLNRLRDSWRHIVLLDGDLLPGEAALLMERCPRAELHRLRNNGLVQAQLREAAARLSDEDLRQALRWAMQAGKPQGSRPSPQLLAEENGLSLPQAQTCLAVLASLRLIRWRSDSNELSPLDWSKLSREETLPEHNALCRYLRSHFAPAD